LAEFLNPTRFNDAMAEEIERGGTVEKFAGSGLSGASNPRKVTSW